MKTYKQFIDVDNMKHAKIIYLALSKLKSTLDIEKPVNYYFGGIQKECIIRLETTMTEEQLDSWLYTRKAGSGYIGCGFVTI